MSETNTESSNDEVVMEELPGCSNCGTPMSGKFCHQCGQSSRSMIKFFGEVIKELFDDIVGYDSRLKHSILPLLFKPGKLTLEYINGRRFYYVMPFRLYLITSILSIFVLQFIIDSDDFVVTDEDKVAALEDIAADLKNSDLSLDEQQQILLPVQKFLLDEKEESKTLKETLIEDSNTDNSDAEFGVTINEDGLRFSGLDVVEEGILKDFLGELETKGKNFADNPKLFFDEFFSIFPYMMFILIPIFALFQKIFYLFSKHFYIEHLVFSIHNHSFINVAFLLSVGLDFSATQLNLLGHWIPQSLAFVLESTTVILSLWMLIYIVLATKRFYQQGWWLTLSKTLALAIIYLAISVMGIMVTAALGVYLF